MPTRHKDRQRWPPTAGASLLGLAVVLMVLGASALAFALAAVIVTVIGALYLLLRHVRAFREGHRESNPPHVAGSLFEPPQEPLAQCSDASASRRSRPGEPTPTEQEPAGIATHPRTSPVVQHLRLSGDLFATAETEQIIDRLLALAARLRALGNGEMVSLELKVDENGGPSRVTLHCQIAGKPWLRLESTSSAHDLSRALDEVCDDLFARVGTPSTRHASTDERARGPLHAVAEPADSPLPWSRAGSKASPVRAPGRGRAGMPARRQVR